MSRRRAACLRATFMRVAALGCLLAAGVASVTACADDGHDGAEIAPERLAERLAGGEGPALVLDVRTPAEFASGHVPGARNVPIDRLPAEIDALSGLRDAEVVVYCESGRRAERARRLLREAGFAKVSHLQGDMAAWRSAGRPVAREDAPGPRP